MFSLRSFIVIATLMTFTNATGIGKAWEVSPVQSNDKSSSLTSRPRLESSAFEVRSVSGVGRLTPTANTRNGQFPAKSPVEEIIKELPSTPKDSGTINVEGASKLREAKELGDLEAARVFVPVIDFHDPTINEFLRRSKESSEVEALPSMWRKFGRRGRNEGNHDGHCSEVEEIGKPSANEDFKLIEEKPRIRRETETEMEKIALSKNVREARLSSPESWSKQPLSVEFRHLTKLEEAASEEEKSARSSAHGLQAPHVDFVTSNRRSFSEDRESRDMPLSPASSRSYDEMPIYRNTLRDRDLDASYTRSLFYPDRYRTERDYFVRGSSEQPYQQDRYRDVDFDLYGRSRPMPKPKRIIYYATLPEIVRKPVDLRNYPRPYDPLTRTSNPAMANDGYYRRRSGSNEPMRHRYYSYPQGNYENYDLFSKRSKWNDRTYDSYGDGMDNLRRREQDIDHASMKDNARNEETMLELAHDPKMSESPKSRDQDKVPWPVKIGAEVSVKDNDRVTGRKIFGQRDDYNRFRNNAHMEQEQPGSAINRN